MPVITWLHISDLHFRDAKSYDSAIVRDALLQDVASRAKIAPELSKIDLIFITGDIAFSGKPEEYAIAHHFLDQLRQVTAVAKKQIFIVPGNHDVDRTQISDESRDLVSKLGNRQAVNELLGNSTDRDVVMARLSNYWKFIDNYYGNQRAFDDAHYYYATRRKVEDKWIAIIGLNSAWASSSDQDQLNLFLGERQARGAIEPASPTEFRIVMMHHPFSWLRDFDADICEPLLLENCSMILHGHLHKPKIIQLQMPGVNSMLVGAGAVYETREFPNSYNYGYLDLDTLNGFLYLRIYSDKDTGFWTADNVTYRHVQGKYRFHLIAEEKAEDTMAIEQIVSSEIGSDYKEKPDRNLKDEVRKNLPQVGLSEWWNKRGYKSDPFLFPNAKDLSDLESLLDVFQSWYIDPNLSASLNAFGGTPTIDEIMSTETTDLVLIYAPTGGGKTFCRLWAAKQIEVSKKGRVVEIQNLLGRLANPEQVSALDLMLCIHKAICEKYHILDSAQEWKHIQHVLTECDDKLSNLSSSQSIQKRAFAFVDDMDQLFNENDAGKNLNVLKAITDLCRAVASQSSQSLALRLFLPLELKEPLQRLLGVKTRQRIREVTLRWDADHCESVLEARLDSCWGEGPNTRHLERLLHQDALTELRRQFRGEHLSPRCVIRLLDHLCNFAYLHNVSVDSTISSDLMVEFMNSKIFDVCPPIQYPLPTRLPTTSNADEGQSS